LQAGELNIKYCGTDNMIQADYFMKPLQGKKFAYFRDLILGIRDIDATDPIRSMFRKDSKWPIMISKDQYNSHNLRIEHF